MIQSGIVSYTDNYYISNGWRTIAKGVIIPVILSLITFYGCFVGSLSIGFLSTLATMAYLCICGFSSLLPTMLYLSLFAYMYNAGGLALYGFICFVYIARCSFRSRKIGYIALWFVLYSVTHLISSALTFGNVAPVLNIFTLLIASLNYKQIDYRNCVLMFVLGVMITSLLGFLKPLSDNLMELLSVDFEEGLTKDAVVRFSGLSFDPNFYTITTIISLMLLIFSGRDKSWFSPVVIVVIMFFGFFSFSKSYIVLLLVLMILSILANQNHKLWKLLVLVLLVSFFMATTFDEIIYVFTERFSGISDMNDLTTGRDSLWQEHLKFISESSLSCWLFGQELPPGMYAAHNTYIELLFRFGIIGTIVDFAFVRRCFKQLNRRWQSWVNLGFIGIMFFSLFNLSAYTFPTLWACLFMVFILISHRSGVTCLSK